MLPNSVYIGHHRGHRTTNAGVQIEIPPSDRKMYIKITIWVHISDIIADDNIAGRIWTKITGNWTIQYFCT